jgi:DNA-directed RNA polymerase specialized sigma24 family protein
LTDGNRATPVHTPEEMCAIIRALSNEDIDRLRLASERMANTLGGIEARDLLHEAFLASTLGKRHCPKDVDPATFLINAMRSHLFNLRRKSKRMESATDHEEELAGVTDETPDLCFERMESLKGIVKEMQQTFGDDERPMLIFEGRAEGMTREEIRELVGLDPVQFESLEKRLRRFVNNRLSPRKAP